MTAGISASISSSAAPTSESEASKRSIVRVLANFLEATGGGIRFQSGRVCMLAWRIRAHAGAQVTLNRFVCLRVPGV